MAFARLSKTWKIDGEAIYEPSYDTKIEYSSLSAEGSGRNALGTMMNKFVRSRITKVSIKYGALTSEQVGEMLSRVQGKEFDLTYPDPISGVTTIRCYCAESSTSLYSSVLYNGLHRDVTFNCVEI